MLEPGDRVPDVPLWSDIRRDAEPLSGVLGEGLVLLCFYLWDWSPT